jgi:hypothetical protein
MLVTHLSAEPLHQTKSLLDSAIWIFETDLTNVGGLLSSYKSFLLAFIIWQSKGRIPKMAAQISDTLAHLKGGKALLLDLLFVLMI